MREHISKHHFQHQKLLAVDASRQGSRAAGGKVETGWPFYTLCGSCELYCAWGFAYPRSIIFRKLLWKEKLFFFFFFEIQRISRVWYWGLSFELKLLNHFIGKKSVSEKKKNVVTKKTDLRHQACCEILSFLASLRLTFHTCKMGIIIVPISHFYCEIKWTHAYGTLGVCHTVNDV